MNLQPPSIQSATGSGTYQDVTSDSHGNVWAAQLFLLSLLVPYTISVGSLLLMPHRLIILILFIPFFINLFITKKSGPIILTDWLLLLSACWSGLALLYNHSFSIAIEPFGIHLIEFFGAYLLARVAIRSAEDFQRVVRTFCLIVLILMVLAAAESVVGRPVALDILPGPHVTPLDIGERMGLRRAQTVFAHPILFGSFVSTGLGLVWFTLRPRWLRLPGVPTVALATIFSLSTGALISFVMQCVFIFWDVALRTLRSRWRIFAILAIAAYILVDLFSNRTPFHVLVNYASFSSGSAYNRILIWQYGTENIWENPLFGLGLRDWSRPSWMSSSVDNFWLLQGMQYGIPAILMTLVALVLLFKRVATRKLSESVDLLARSGYLVSFGGLAIAGGTVHYWHAMMAFAMFFFGSGAWIITTSARESMGAKKANDREASKMSRYTRQPSSGEPISARNRTVRTR